MVHFLKAFLLQPFQDNEGSEDKGQAKGHQNEEQDMGVLPPVDPGQNISHFTSAGSVWTRPSARLPPSLIVCQLSEFRGGEKIKIPININTAKEEQGPQSVFP